MLDNITKKRIDDCRDVLVGKVPDPKSQIEQITIALIFKFMDDMDKSVEDLGGNKFFSGEYEKYSWRVILDPAISGSEMLNLYSEALDKLQFNENLPELFRNIFKNAYLPYRDPNTLKMFLKYINDFEYSHSEKLGDAFEYLLSVMGSQGDAGQFRTPRHIIDFIVEVLEPQKNDTIADPACGTAGFLLSAYKYILKSNTKDKFGDQLKPDEKKKIVNNIVGYDISPDMVRLSLVNMYLHNFPTPKIYEYDTLSSEDRWDEKFDVILANPPFMTPKGGISPHKKFGVQANKAEVLFTDYIAEHLNKDGRAGIIVPEGIIFQNANAYKSLRKMLVKDNYLIAVISLPSGVFQPYSGVKTTILILDKKLAKINDKILFIKVENDGFSLGSQRKEIEKNDLPNAISLIKKYKDSIINQTEIELDNNSLLIEKSKIAENEDYLLSGDQYKEKNVKTSIKYKEFKIEELIQDVKYTNKVLKTDFLTKGNYPIIDQSENFIAGYWNNLNDVFQIESPVVIFGDHTRNLKYIDFNFVLGADGVKILKPSTFLQPKFFYYSLKFIELENLGYSRHWKILKEKKIPLPPISVQEEIVKEIEGYEKIIEGAKQVVNNYKPQIKIDPSWEMVELGSLGKICMCKRIYKEQTKDYGDIPFYKIGTFGGDPDSFISKEVFNEFKEKFSYPKKGDILISTSGTIGRLVVFDGKDAYFQDSNIVWINNNETKILNSFLYYSLYNIDWKSTKSVTIARLYNGIIENTQIQFPPISIQQIIVNQIENEQKLVNANKELIQIYEQKIKDKINEVWGAGEEELLHI